MTRDQFRQANFATSPPTERTPHPSQRRAVLHHREGKDTQEYGREYKRKGEVVEYFPVGGADRGGDLSGVVAEEVLRGQADCRAPLGNRN